MDKRVLIVDDEQNVCDVIGRLLERDGCVVERAHCAEDAVGLLAPDAFDCVITDICMPGMSGIDLLDHTREMGGVMPVILLTAQASLQSAVDAVNKGAYHFLRKPFGADELRSVVQNALAFRNARKENIALKHELRRNRVDRKIIGDSDAIRQLLTLVDKVADSDCTVLLTGESGTGKELFARAIHAQSQRDPQPFVSVNCGALPENLLESELFGHVKGSFTGAHRNKDGLFLVANQGTLLLDEVAETSLGIQVKLLRALQEKEILPVGGTRAIPIDARVIAATNQDLDRAVAEGQFRADLFYRLNVIPIRVPALRERREDIPTLISHFLQQAGSEQRFTADAMEVLQRYNWPGNVRELENVVARAVILEDGDEIDVSGLPDAVRTPVTARGKSGLLTHSMTLEELEQTYIEQVLSDSGWRKKRASEVLGIDTSTLYRKIQRYSLRRDPAEAALRASSD